MILSSRHDLVSHCGINSSWSNFVFIAFSHRHDIFSHRDIVLSSWYYLPLWYVANFVTSCIVKRTSWPVLYLFFSSFKPLLLDCLSFLQLSQPSPPNPLCLILFAWSFSPDSYYSTLSTWPSSPGPLRRGPLRQTLTTQFFRLIFSGWPLSSAYLRLTVSAWLSPSDSYHSTLFAWLLSSDLWRGD